MSNQNPVPNTAVGAVLAVTRRGRSQSIGATPQTPVGPEETQGWLREQVQSVSDAARALTDPADATADELSALNDARRRIAATAGKPAPTATELKDARQQLTAAREAIVSATATVQTRLRKDLDAIVLEAKALQTPPDALPEETGDIDAARRIVATAAAADPLQSADVTSARDAVPVLRKAVASTAENVTKRLAEASDTLREQAKKAAEDERLKEATVDELRPVQEVGPAIDELLKTPTNANLKAAQKLLDGLPALVNTCKQAIDTRLARRAKAVGDLVTPKTEIGRELAGALPNHAKKLKQLRDAIAQALATKPLTTARVTQAEDDKIELVKLHAEYKKLVADLGGAATSGKLKDAFADGDALDAFVAEGLGGKHRLLVQLLNGGCGGDPQKLKSFNQAFAGKPDRQRLNRLIDGSGLGDKPEALSALLTVGCGGDGAAFKQLTERFTDPTDPGAETADLKNLNAIVAAGGLGDQPQVLGHLLKTGCPGKPGDAPWDFQLFCAEFGKSPAELAKLLNAGGFAAKGGANPVRADSLAQLLAIGCDGDATQLMALARSGSVAKVKGLLESGGLGARPESLAHVYKTACEQDPAKLAGLHDAFDASGGARLGRMKALLEQANLKQSPQMLADILATGCNGRPDKLADMAVAFESEMGQLKEMVDTWGDESGASIDVLTDSRHLADDYAKLQSSFAFELNDRFPNPAARERLLQEAPRFTRTEVTTPKDLNDGLDEPLAFGPGELDDFAGTDCDYLLAHVCERHLQSHFAFEGAKAASTPIDHSNTQFPDTVTPQEVADLMKAALTGADGRVALAGIKTEIDEWSRLDGLYQQSKAWAHFAARYPNPAAHERHRLLHQRWLAYDNWFSTAVPVPRGKTKGQLWTAYDHNRKTWRGKVPEAPPVARPAEPEARHAPPPIPPNVGVHADPGRPPKPQRDFVHDGITFRVGAKKAGATLKINQLFPLSSVPAGKLKQFNRDQMRALLNAMVLPP